MKVLNLLRILKSKSVFKSFSWDNTNIPLHSQVQIFTIFLTDVCLVVGWSVEQGLLEYHIELELFYTKFGSLHKKIKIGVLHISSGIFWPGNTIASDKWGRGGGIHIVFFLFLHKNICCGYSLEAPQWGASNEYHNTYFRGEIWKISVLFCWKKCAMWSYVHSYVIGEIRWWGIKNQALFTAITKTHLFKYIENFTTKNWNFSDKELWYFSYFCSKT